MPQRKKHNISGLEDVYGGSMVRDESYVYHELDARDGTDTYGELAEFNIVTYGSAIVEIATTEMVA
jgi:hypothetical protein